MPDYNIGFGKNVRGGFFDSIPLVGGLTRSVSAAMSPHADEYGGSLRAFIDPAPVRQADIRDLQLKQIQPALQQHNELMKKALLSLESNDPVSGMRIMNDANEVLRSAGFNVGDTEISRKFFDGMQKLYNMQGIRKLDPTDPVKYGQGMAPYLDTPEQARELAGTLGSLLNTRATQQKTEQETQQGEQIFPEKMREQTNKANLAGEQVTTEQGQQRYLDAGTTLRGAETGLANARTTREGVRTDLDTLKRDYAREHGELIGTHGMSGRMGAGGDTLDDERSVINQVNDLITAVDKGKGGMMGGEFGLDEVNQQLNGLNLNLQEIQRRTGRVKPQYEAVAGPDKERLADDGVTKVKIPNSGKPIIRMKGMGAPREQAQQQQPTPQEGRELSPAEVQKLPGTMSDDDVLKSNVDVGSFTPAQRELRNKYARETLANIETLKRRGASEQEIQQYKVSQARKFAQELAGGGMR